MTIINREDIQRIINDDWLLMDDCEGNKNCDVVKELARIALASLTAEPVLYAAEETLAYAKMGELHLTCLSEPMGDAVIPLYAAQPAPVVNAEYGDAYQGAREDLSIWKSRALEAEDRVRELEQINDHLVKEEQGESRMGESVIREPAPVVPDDLAKAFISAIEKEQDRLFGEDYLMDSKDCIDVIREEALRLSACRAAMFQGSQPVSNRDELPVIGWLRSDYNNDDKRDPNAPLFMLGSNDPSETWGVKYIPLSGNSPAIPDGWVMVPIEPTEHMIVEGFESEPDEFFSDEEVWEAYDAMSGCQQAAHRAKLCWSAMIAASPAYKKVNRQG